MCSMIKFMYGEKVCFIDLNMLNEAIVNLFVNVRFCYLKENVPKDFPLYSLKIEIETNANGNKFKLSDSLRYEITAWSTALKVMTALSTCRKKMAHNSTIIR